jgi:hypothetical protein
MAEPQAALGRGFGFCNMHSCLPILSAKRMEVAIENLDEPAETAPKHFR